MACCRGELRPITAELKQEDWDRRPIFTDVRVGHFIFVKDWGKFNCYHYDNHYPKGDHQHKVRMNKGHIYGPVIHYGVFEKFFAVQMPMLHYGLRWINIWYCDKNLPLKGVVYGLPISADAIDRDHM
eukprot:2177790-Pyramimonas_sp.AAC.1